MATIDYYRQLFDTGVASFVTRPSPASQPDTATARLLLERYLQHRAEVAGPLIDHDPALAWQAAQFATMACWFLVSRSELPGEMTRMMGKLPAPETPAGHLSIDLSLRFAVTVFKRSTALNPEDPLTVLLGETLRACPLTGVLADALPAPTGDLSFGAHAGLQMLYAERLTGKFKAEWLPPEGPTREMARLVWQQAGKKWPG